MLAAGLDAGVDLLKPNHGELERLVEQRLPTLGDVVEAAEGLLDRAPGGCW